MNTHFVLQLGQASGGCGAWNRYPHSVHFHQGVGISDMGSLPFWVCYLLNLIVIGLFLKSAEPGVGVPVEWISLDGTLEGGYRQLVLFAIQEDQAEIVAYAGCSRVEIQGRLEGTNGL